jgi:hypothetical protein
LVRSMGACVVVEELEESGVNSAKRVENKWKEGGARWCGAMSGWYLVTLRLYASLMGMLTSFRMVSLRYCFWIGETTVTSAKIDVLSLWS